MAGDLLLDMFSCVVLLVFLSVAKSKIHFLCLQLNQSIMWLPLQLNSVFGCIVWLRILILEF